MNRNAILIFVAIVTFGLSNAQEVTPEKRTSVIPKDTSVVAKSTPVDSIAKSATTIQQLGIQDNPMFVISKDKRYELLDDVSAAAYDSLWLRELYKGFGLFDTITQTIQKEIALEDSTAIHKVNTEVLKQRLAVLNEKTPFNISYNSSLESVINLFLTRKRQLIENMLVASQFYFPLFESHLDAQNIPLELKYLAIVESALNPKARSRVGATGLWQFMYTTGKMYDLEVSSYVDERSDPIASTEAAGKYLKKLYGIFNDWDLALAAYNSGPGNVNKAIRRSGGYTNYWNIRRILPRETAGYLPAFLATMYLFEYAEEHGFERPELTRPYFVTDTVRVKATITFDQISKLVHVPVEDLEVLNPSYKLNIIPFVEGKNYVLRLPKHAIGPFVSNEAAIYAHVTEELKAREKPLPELTNTQNQIRYRVKNGDFLGKIANKYRVRVSDIKRWNGLRSNNLRIGQRLTIYPRNPTAVAKPKPSSKTMKIPVSKRYTVKNGDSLWVIANKFPGISIQNLRDWNGISGNSLKPGTTLKLCACP